MLTGREQVIHLQHTCKATCEIDSTQSGFFVEGFSLRYFFVGPAMTTTSKAAGRPQPGQFSLGQLIHSNEECLKNWAKKVNKIL